MKAKTEVSKGLLTVPDSDYTRTSGEGDILSSSSLNSWNRAIRHKTRIINTAVTSNLTLQMLMYYNFFYSFLHAFFFIACNLYKFWIYKDIGYTDILFFVFTWIYFPIECMILYFGYIGNIRESVSLIYLAVSRVDCISYFHLLFQNSNLSCDHFSKISVSSWKSLVLDNI